MSEQAGTPPVPASQAAEPGSVASRLWDATRRLITITDHRRALEKEDTRLQVQVQELSRLVLDLVKEVREISGQMKGIEKRLEDKDKMVEAVIKLRVAEEVEKAVSRLAAAEPAATRRLTRHPNKPSKAQD